MSKFVHNAARYIVPASAKSGGVRRAFDVEADGLVDDATKLHCIVIANLDSDQVDAYGPEQTAAALQHLARADYLTGHNITGFDLPLLRRLRGWAPSPGCIVMDTLVAGRLILPNIDDLDDQATAMGDPALGKLRGRYSLEAWGLRLGIPKTGTDIEDWSAWTPKMQERCVGDVKIGKAVWQFLQPDGYSQRAMELEHRAALICGLLTATGAPFDVAAAEQLHEKWTTRRSELEEQLLQQFPGTNLNSRRQIGVLLEARGWVPEKRSEKTGQPKIDDELLESIPELYPEFAGLAEHYTLGRRLGQLSNGQQAWCKNVGADGRIHGGLVHIGTPHSRAKHLDPNLAQVPNPKKGKPFAAECRALFRASNGWVFVTADQASLQDRGYAHYLHAFDNGTYAKAFLDGADTHWRSAVTLGLLAASTPRNKQDKVHEAIREGAKRFRYAFLYGCGFTTAGRIISDTVRAVHQIDNANDLQHRFFGGSARPSEAALMRVGKQALNSFEAGTPGLRRLRESLKAHAHQHGWLPGLDGRRVPVRALYSALNFIVTSSEAIICKRWLVQTYDELCTRFSYGWDGDVVIVLWVHDELVCCCRPEIAEQVGEILVRHAREPGEFYSFKVPLDAEYKIGRSWAGEPLADAQVDIEPTIAADDTENSEPGGPDRANEPATDNGHACGDRGASNAGLIWLTPASIEVTPDSAEFAAILASLSEEDCAVVRPPEVPRGNGQGRGREEPTQTAKLSRSTLRVSNKIHCPFHDDHNPSLELYADGHYHCYACGAHGAIEELPEAARAPTPGPTQTDGDTLKLAIQLWQAANPIHATLAERYLTEVRKLDLTILPDIDAVLRFHAWCPFDGNRHPCLLALFRDVETDVIAGIHRIALTADAEKIGRKMLGAWPHSRAIKLRPTGEKLLIGEGIETTIGGSMKVHWSSALWACGSAGAIEKLPLISGVVELAILVDRDRNGIGLRSARSCAGRWYPERKVTLLTPRQDETDFNDLIREVAT
jgi:DNA polymerase I-like protein with 3'-5' exonuclease and polymerase domains